MRPCQFRTITQAAGVSLETSQFPLTICWPVLAIGATNGDITDMMQHTETSEGRVLVNASSWISSNEKDNYSDKPSPLLTAGEPQYQKTAL